MVPRAAARPGCRPIGRPYVVTKAQENVILELGGKPALEQLQKLWEGLTFEAIAEACGIPLNTAASRYRYGLDKLRARLRPLYEEIK